MNPPMEQVTANVYANTRIRGCNPSYVVTNDGVVVVDTPQLPTKAVAMREEAESHGPIRYVINTEHHVDHIFGNYYFKGAGEVVHLCLEDIDWTEGLLTVQGKGGYWRQLPLPVDVGEAIARYLRSGRPPCTTRRVFVRMRAPRAGFASSVAIDSIVSRALARAGLSPPAKGAHLLRHSLATRMLRKGASLAEIGQLLGHHLPQSTEIYAKVDERALTDLAQPWPGGTR